MSMDFLERIAGEVLSGKHGKPEDLAIVLPTRRAGLYFKKTLGKTAGRVLASPKVFAVEDLIKELFPGKILDPVEALFTLYGSYLKVSKEEAEPFEEFNRWAPTFFRDIQDLDRSLANAKELFGNLQGIRELEHWSLNSPDLTELQKKYLDFWNMLYRLYEQFRSDLSAMGMAYEAMALRSLSPAPDPPGAKTLICGFNAFSNAEKKLFEAWYRAGKASFYWDADVYYYADPFHEAGKFLREFVPELHPEKETPLWIGDHLSSEPRSIRITGVPGLLLQARYAGQILKDIPEGTEHRTAVVLADESLLFPMLNSLPENIKTLNVSMGSPLKGSTVYSFIESLLLLHEHAEAMGRKDKQGQLLFHHRDLCTVLRQPSLNGILEKDTGIQKLLKDITEHNRIFLGRQHILSFFEGANAEKMSELLSMNEKAAILSTLEKLLYEAVDKMEHGTRQTEQEYSYEALRLVSMIGDLDKRYGYFKTLNTLVAYLRQVLREAAVPFYGEPLTGLQIMGLLETRALDFDRIILLGANEQILPSGRNSPSFIPYDLRNYFGLPTHQDREAIFAYHFYRLIQRCPEVHCIYSTIKDTFGSGEQSRFLTQLQHELGERNPGASIESGLRYLSPTVSPAHPITAGKSDEVLQELHRIMEKGISPTALHMYLSCPLRFFLTRVAGLGESDEVEESIDSRNLGIFLHGALEHLYRPYVGQALTTEILDDLASRSEAVLKEQFLKRFSEDDMSRGGNLLAFEAGKSYLRNFLEWDRSEVRSCTANGMNYELVAVEKSLEYPLKPGVLLKGIADRIDKKGDALRIMDYKTGQVNDKELESESIEEIFTDVKGKSLQLLSYSLFCGEDPQAIEAGIYSFRNSKGGLKTVSVAGREIIDPQLRAGFRVKLAALTDEILDAKKTFVQTEDVKVCEYCEFREMCRR